MKEIYIENPLELWNYVDRSGWLHIANQDGMVQQLGCAVKVIRETGESEILQFAVVKTITKLEMETAEKEELEKTREAQAKLSVEDLLSLTFIDHHYPKNKLFFNTYYKEQGLMHLLFHPIESIERWFYIREVNERLKWMSAYEKDGKFWICYKGLYALQA